MIDPHIHVVILTHNRVALLNRCIRHVLVTATTPHTIHVVDNASTDPKVREKIEYYTTTFGNVRALLLPTNVGVSARNHALDKIAEIITETKAVESEDVKNSVTVTTIKPNNFIAFIDDDVLVNPLWDRAMLSYFADPKVGAVGPGGSFIKPDWNDFTPQLLNIKATPGIEVDELTGYIWMMRAELLKATRYDTDKFFWFEEVDLQFPIKQAGYKIVCCGNVAAHFCNRDPRSTDWTERNRNIDIVRRKWFCKRKELNLRYIQMGLPDNQECVIKDRIEHPELYEKKIQPETQFQQPVKLPEPVKQEWGMVAPHLRMMREYQEKQEQKVVPITQGKKRNNKKRKKR